MFMSHFGCTYPPWQHLDCRRVADYNQLYCQRPTRVQLVPLGTAIALKHCWAPFVQFAAHECRKLFSSSCCTNYTTRICSEVKEFLTPCIVSKKLDSGVTSWIHPSFDKDCALSILEEGTNQFILSDCENMQIYVFFRSDYSASEIPVWSGLGIVRLITPWDEKCNIFYNVVQFLQ